MINFGKNEQCPEGHAQYISSNGIFFCHSEAKLMERVKIAHSFSQSASNQFHVIILSLPM